MCGLAGYLNISGDPLRADVLRAMGSAMAHRGPDSADIHHDADQRLGFSHRRLSIMDLSSAGAQPMTSHSGRYVMVYNGAVYNHPNLREELGASHGEIPWRGESDTETMLALFDAYGVEASLPRMYGMFAFAVWDRETRSLTLVRDRLGEKPLYYGMDQGRLLFASDLIGLSAVPGFSPAIAADAVQSLLRLGCIPTPQCIYQGFAKLPAGQMLTIRDFEDPRSCRPRPYWTLPDCVHETAAARSRQMDYATLLDETEAQLRDVVGSQLLSDVPVGSFLSGGIDSSLITALMKQTAGGDVLTYSIGFESDRFNEATQAGLVAEALQTEHHEVIMTEKDALAVISDLSSIYAEPFADSSQIPTILLSRMTREHVGVALSGDGGDEMFGGYNRHVLGPGYWKEARRVPGAMRRAGAGLVDATQNLVTSEGPAARLARSLGLPVSTVDKLAHFADSFGRAKDFSGLYQGLIAAGGADQTRPPLIANDNWTGNGLSDAEKMMLWDAGWYLPDDIMVKVDRASMSCSLETRAPFLDLRAVEQAWRLPIAAKISGSTGKQILRDILYRHVPRDLVDRPKQGFSIPLNAWLRGDLRSWGEDLMARVGDLEEFGINALELRTLWQDHQSGRRTAGHRLWSVLMLLQWLERKPAATAT